MARFHCARCGIDKDVPERFLGRKVRCPGCGRELPIEAEEMEPAQEESPDASGEATFRCAACGASHSVPARHAGRKARCPQCGQIGVVASGPFGGEPDETEVNLDDLAEDFSQAMAHDAELAGAMTAEARGDGTEERLDDFGPDAASPAGTPDLASVSAGRALLNGLALGVITVFFSLALSLAPSLGAGEPGLASIMLQMALVAALIGTLVYTVRSRVPFASAAPEGVTCAGLFLLARAAASLPGTGASAQALAATVVAAVLCTALVAGVICLFLARFREGDWMRFVPFPVIGGVLAGVGLLLVRLAWLASTGSPLGPELLFDVLRGGTSTGGAHWRWLPSLLFGLLLFLAYRRVRPLWWLAAPLLLALGWGLAVPHLPLAGLPPELAASLGRAGTASPRLADILSLHAPGYLAVVDWSGLTSLPGLIFALGLLLALNASAKALVLEEHIGREVSPGPELRALGAANLLSGIATGFPVSLSLGRSLGALRSGGLGIFGTLAAGAVCAAALFAGEPVLSAIPAFVPAGLLWFMGLNLLKRWLVDIVAEDLRPEEYACLLLAFLATVVAGLAHGIAVGVFLALMLGLARHSSRASIKSIMSGDAHHSNVDRAAVQADALQRIGESILILRLQGFLSGGALSAALRVVWERLEEPGRPSLRYVVLDFTLIKSFGSGLTRVLGGMARLGREQKVRMVLTNVPFVLEERLERAGLSGEGGDGFLLFRNLDYALEWCEDRLLEEAGLLEGENPSLADLFAPVFPDADELPRLLRILQRVEVREGEYVFRQGDASDSLYFVESGMLTVELEIPGGKTVRLKKLGEGSIFGEMGLYTHEKRSASVRANEPSVVHRLSKKRLAVLRGKLPHLATSLDRFLVTMLARRVADANVMVRDLMR